MLILSDSLLVDAFATLTVTWAGLAVATNTHMASHGAVSDKRWVNRALTYFGYPFLLQISANYWHHKHLATHHVHTNIFGMDEDVDLSPFFALDQAQVDQSTGFWRWFYRYQGIVLPIALFFSGFVVAYTGWVFLFGKLLDNKARKLRHWVDLGLMVSNVILWWVAPMLIFAPWDVVLFNVARFGLSSYGMFALFAPAHYPADALLLSPDAKGRDRVHLIAVSTLNFKTGPLGRLLCAGVEFQLEHHLFPSISHVHLPEVSKHLQRYFENHGYPYRTLGWGDGIWKSYLTFFRPKPIVTELDGVKARPAQSGIDRNALDHARPFAAAA